MVDREIAAVEREVEDYSASLDANDAAEAAEPDAKPRPERGHRRQAHRPAGQTPRGGGRDVATLEASGQTQLSRTDADARLLSKNGQSVAGYNVQIAVDDKHKLIVADEVVNDGNDTGQLHAMAQAACSAVGADTLQAVADTGYFNGETLKACEDSGIEAFVPERRGAASGWRRRPRFGIDAFVYDATADAYRCPAGKLLHAMGGGKLDQSGKLRICYASRRMVCSGCPMRHKCLSPKATRRVVERWEHEDVIERHRQRMATSEAMMRRRKALVEHPFGTLKCRAGYRHFLMRGFDKVRGELGLMVLCYNFTRALNIIGLEKLVAWFAARCFLAALLACWRRSLGNAAECLRGGCRVGWSGMMAAVAGPLRRDRTICSAAAFAR